MTNSKTTNDKIRLGKYLFIFIAAALCITGFAGTATAGGTAEPWQMLLQEPASPTMERITDFHNMLLWIISAITLFVLVLLLFILARFNAKANPEPSKTTHNTLIEVIWTVVPVIILIVIAVPSMKLLYYADRSVDAEMTIKATGYQWNWAYDYMDVVTNDPAEGEEPEYLRFTSYMIPEEDIDESMGQIRLLSVDNPLVLPVDTTIRVLVTAAPTDVLHSFAVPAFGIKTDAVPGRMNETWVRIDKPGTYYGQCSELCGKGHAYMPIEVKAVPKEEYEAWLDYAQEEYASYYDFKDRAIQMADAKGRE